MMNNREQEQNEFFEYLKKVVIEGQKRGENVINYDFIYRFITRYPNLLKQNTIRFDELYFKEWNKRFDNSKDVLSFVDPNWKYFCQFVPFNIKSYRKMINSNNHIKLYIPLKPSHMYEGANQIFDFIGKNKIPHWSKIGRNVRNDSIVVRVGTKEDAEKIMKFVKNNKFLQEGLLKTNPFTPRSNGVGYACDASYSYNETITYLIKDYFNKNRNNLESINVNGFNNHVKQVYKKIFGSKQTAEELYYSSPEFGAGGVFESVKEPIPYNKSETEKERIRQRQMEYIFSIKVAMGLYLESTKQDFNKDKYYEYFESTRIPDRVMLEDRFNQQEYDKETLQLLYKGIKTLTKRFESSEIAKNQLREYVDKYSLNFITSLDNLRDIYRTKKFDRRLIEYIDRNQISLNELLSNIDINKKRKIDKPASKLRYVYEVMSNKRGQEYAYRNICTYLRSNDASYLTRDLGIRQEISTSNLRDRLLSYVEEKQISIEEFVESITRSIKPQEVYLETAIKETKEKYDRQYQSGRIDLDGLKWSAAALAGLIKDNEYKGFTRDNQARDNLRLMKVDGEAASVIVSRKLGITAFELETMPKSELRNKLISYVQILTAFDYNHESIDLIII